jgi:hypothetical protein
MKESNTGIAIDPECRESADSGKKRYDPPRLERLGRVTDLTRYDISVWVP